MNIQKQYFLIKMLNKLLKRGYSLNESLDLMETMNKKTVIILKKRLDEGIPLSTIFKQLHFKSLVYESVMIGEASNRLHEVIHLIEENMTFHLKLSQQMSKVLVYPILLFVFSILGFEFIRINLYPILQTLIDTDSGKNQLLAFFAFESLKFLGGGCFGMGCIFIGFKRLTNIFPFMKMMRSLYLSNHITILLTCGSSLEEGMQLLKVHLSSKVYNISTLETALLTDAQKPKLLDAYTIPFITYLHLGMKANDLVSVLADFQLIYSDVLFSQLSKIAYYIQFLLFSLISINILLIYYLIMLPMFSMKF